MNTHIIAFGAGVDSSALLAINLKRDQAAALIGISRADLDEAFPPVDAAMFSDTGKELQATYANVDRFEKAYAEAQVPFYRVRREKETIVEWLDRNGTIPLMPGGKHICSLKFKTEVLHKNAEKLFPGSTFTWSIGIEAEEDRRCNKAFTVKSNDTHKSAFPLRLLGLDRLACINLIAKLGFGLVVKSSCPFCPYMQPEEIAHVIATDPEAWAQVKQIEAKFQATSPVKHGRWLAAGKPVDRAGRALRGMWSQDSWANGARLYAKRVNGKQLSTTEWEALLSVPHHSSTNNNQVAA